MEPLDLDINDSSSPDDVMALLDNNAPTSSYREARKGSIQRCVQSLAHACQCSTICGLPSCQKMKRVVRHTKICRRKRQGDCPVCKQLIAICCYHAKHCQETKCSVPFCSCIKQKIKSLAEKEEEKTWSPSLSVGLRDYYAHKLAITLYPSTIDSSGPDVAVLHEAKKIEKDLYKKSRSRHEYYHLIADKIDKIKKSLKAKKYLNKKNCTYVTIGDTSWRSGAQRKKRRKLKKQDALDGTAPAGLFKRPRAALSGDSEDTVTKRMKAQGQSPSTGSYRDTVAAVKLAIVTVKYPDEYLTVQDLAPIQELIIEKLEEAPDPLHVLTVASGVVTGAVHVSCSDSDAAHWLRGAIHNVDIGSLKLKVVDAKDLPKPVKMAWKSRSLALKDCARALKLLQRLNPKLSTDNWKVVNTLTEDTGIRRIVLMDRVSADVIKTSGYSLPGGIEQYTFKLLEEDKGTEPTKVHAHGMHNALGIMSPATEEEGQALEEEPKH